MRNFNGNKIAIFGDWHGNLPFAVTALDYVYHSEKPDVYFHVGDFGFWPVDNEEAWIPEYLPGLERLLEAQNRIMIWVDGNHEHHIWLKAFPIGEDGLRKISDHIYHLPRGAAVMVGDKKIVGFGGAHSTDRKFRIKDYSWFDEELITEADLEKALSNETADIIISHEAPMLRDRAGTGSFDLDQATARQRDFVANAAAGLGAKLLVHGHHHHAYIDSYGATQVIGLGCDETVPISQTRVDLNHVIVELQEL